MSEKFYSKTFVTDLLIIRAIQNSDHESPKTAQQIFREVELERKKFFPSEPATVPRKKNSVTATIYRHIRDMNQSGLYDIKVHNDNKRGYYNAGQIFSTAETAAIVAALYQTSLSAEEKQKLFDKLKTVTDTDGGSIVYSFKRQLKFDGTNKDSPTLSKIQTICQGIVEGKKISFRLRSNIPNSKQTQVTAAPHFIIAKGNELFLTATVGGAPKDFKLNLMSDIEISYEDFQDDKNIFPTEKTNNGAPTVKLWVSFPESFAEAVANRFGEFNVTFAAQNGNISAKIHAKETDDLYGWLRCHCDKIKIFTPRSVKDKLRTQLNDILKSL